MNLVNVFFWSFSIVISGSMDDFEVVEDDVRLSCCLMCFVWWIFFGSEFEFFVV